MAREQRAESLDSIVTDDSEDPLTCPLTQRLFHDPVILVASGVTYEASALEECLMRPRAMASRVTIANFTAHTSRRVVGQWGGAGGAICEDHFGVDGASRGSSRAARVVWERVLVSYAR